MAKGVDGLVAAARGFTPVISGYALEIDRERRLPEELIVHFKEAGFFRMLLAEEFGGLGADPIAATEAVEVISQANASVGWVVMILSATSYWASSLLSDDAANEIFRSETDVNIAGTLVPHGKAERVDGGWRLSGQWPFGSGCLHADWMGTGSVLYEDGQPLTGTNGGPEVRLFLTPASDCSVLDTWDTTGLRGTGSHDYTVEDIFVPERFVIEHPLMAEPVRTGPRYAYPAVAVPMMAAVSLGAARAAVDGLASLLGEKLDRRSGAGCRRSSGGICRFLPLRHFSRGLECPFPWGSLDGRPPGPVPHRQHQRRSLLRPSGGPGLRSGRRLFHI